MNSIWNQTISYVKCIKIKTDLVVKYHLKWYILINTYFALVKILSSTRYYYVTNMWLSAYLDFTFRIWRLTSPSECIWILKYHYRNAMFADSDMLYPDLVDNIGCTFASHILLVYAFRIFNFSFVNSSLLIQ